MQLGRPALVCLAVCLTVSACSIGPSPAGPDDDDTYAMTPNASVVDVVDGDTLVVDIDGVEERVRLIGIDTPESVAAHRPVECYGKEASDRMEELVPPGTPIHLERDIEARDQYERLLAYVYRADDGLHINLDQVAQGYAEAMSYPPNTALQPDFDDAERQARSGNAGLWGVCGGPDVPIGPPPG
jgi:micrococcal nuclease